MRNRTAGLIIISISLLIGTIIYLFNKALTDIVNTSCSHGPSCPMWGTINVQTNIGIAIMIFVILVGLYFVFFADRDLKNPKEHSPVMNRLSKEEKNIAQIIMEAEGTIFQSELVEKTGFSKVKVTRILDRLEGRGVIERKRRGMTNVVVLKEKGL